jgi:hypothetical protein
MTEPTSALPLPYRLAVHEDRSTTQRRWFVALVEAMQRTVEAEKRLRHHATAGTHSKGAAGRGWRNG